MKKEEKINVGGQAVIEGVMMRSPERVAVAVRRPDGKIVLQNKPYASFTKRNKFWALPIIRGAVILIESMVLGVKALTFSGDIAIAEEEKKEAEKNKKKNKKQKKSSMSNLMLFGTVAFSLVFGFGLFFYLPLILTDLLGAKSGFWFNVVDGIIRTIIFLLYLSLITLWKDIRRVFKYHGAEHQTIFTFEDGKDLNVKNASQYLQYHPRCGTSFIITVLLVSIIVFMFLGRPETILERLIRFAFIPIIGGLSYEIIKLSDKKKNNPIVKMFIKPGLWLQRITALKPDESMLEVAIVALNGSLGIQYADDPNVILAEQLETE